jgi:hypothetical protein
MDSITHLFGRESRRGLHGSLGQEPPGFVAGQGHSLPAIVDERHGVEGFREDFAPVRNQRDAGSVVDVVTRLEKREGRHGHRPGGAVAPVGPPRELPAHVLSGPRDGSRKLVRARRIGGDCQSVIVGRYGAPEQGQLDALD